MKKRKTSMEKLALKALDYEINGFTQPPYVRRVTKKCQQKLQSSGIVLPQKIIYISDAEYLLILAGELKKYQKEVL